MEPTKSSSKDDSDRPESVSESSEKTTKRRTTRARSVSPRTRKKAAPEEKPSEEKSVRAQDELELDAPIPAVGEVLSFGPEDEPAPRAETPVVSEKSAPAREENPQPAAQETPAGESRSAQENQPQQQQPNPQDQGGGSGRFDRFDRFNRHGKKGKHGGHQQGGGQGGGGNQFQQKGGNRHPQQPPPPTLNFVTGEIPSADRFQNAAVLEATAADLRSSNAKPLFIDELAPLTLAELTARAKAEGATFEVIPSRQQVMAALLNKAAGEKRAIVDRGWLDLTDRGYGYIAHGHDNYRLHPGDTYVPEGWIRRYGLKRGHHIEVQVQPALPHERCPAAITIRSVMGGAPEKIVSVPAFEDLVPYYPTRRLHIEVPERDAGAKDVSMRLVDVITPIGFGQRGLIVAPPRTGKTVLLQGIANSITANFPEARLILLLVDERPEEVTDFKRHTKGEVVSSTFDESPENHVHAAEMVIERSRRLVEQGEHVVILLDSITRLARAYNVLASNSGKIMSGGIEANALQKPKRFFGSARNIEGGGSLTIIGTALVDTGSKMDEVIFEEFKGTGNMELHLDRELMNKRIFPALNIDKSGTRKEELIYHPDEMQRIYSLRRAMQGIPPTEAMEMLVKRLRATKTNAEFLIGMNR